MHANANAAISGRSHSGRSGGQRRAYDMLMKVLSPMTGAETRAAKAAITDRRNGLIVHAPSIKVRRRKEDLRERQLLADMSRFDARLIQ